MKQSLSLVAVLAALLGALAGCSSDQKLSRNEEKKLADAFQHPPKLEDLPPAERARVEGMMKAHMTPPGK